jgi:hypothetical protein
MTPTKVEAAYKIDDLCPALLAERLYARLDI